ncbi:MAG: hypothetical protein HQ564_09360 [Candidatus Saganbacteria bacterium]|nr:hypothetical protein [Candidatus Saganbacteria bacterium]
MDIEESIKEQINKLSVIQYLIWQKELPEGFNREAIELSYCYHLMDIPFSQKLNRFSLAVMRVMLDHLIKKHDLPKEIEKLKVLEKTFRLSIEDKEYSVSDCSSINSLLKEQGLSIRLCSGFYGRHKFYLLAQASEERVKDYTVYRLKKEIALTPGCHLLMAAMVGGKNVFLRESSARFLFYQKWRNAYQKDTKENLLDKIKKYTLQQFDIKGEEDYKGKSGKLIASFIDNLFLHELNHSSMETYIKDPEILALAQASTVMGENVLSHLLEVFTDWLPGKDQKSPLLKIIESKKMGRLSLYIADNWFYHSSFPEMRIFSTLGLAPMFKHLKEGRFDWQGLISEITHLNNGSLLALYKNHFEETARGLKKIVSEAKYVLTYRPIGFRIIAAQAEAKIKDKNKFSSDESYLVTYWSNIFSYLKKFSNDGHKKAKNYLEDREKELVNQVNAKIGNKSGNLEDVIISKATECFGEIKDA